MWDSSGSEHHETPSIILHLSKANKTCLKKKSIILATASTSISFKTFLHILFLFLNYCTIVKLAMTSLFLPLALILATFWMLGSIESAGAVAVADPSNSRNYQDARSKVFRDVADNIISHSGARYEWVSFFSAYNSAFNYILCVSNELFGISFERSTNSCNF